MEKEKNNKIILYNTEDGKTEGELSKNPLFKPNPEIPEVAYLSPTQH